MLSDLDLANAIQALAFKYLGETPFIRVGQWPKRLLVYRQQPGTITSASYKSAAGNNDGIEILSAGKNFTIHGFHVEADKMYGWPGGANPLEDRPRDAPLVKQQHVNQFIEAVGEIMPFAVGRSGGGGTANAPRHVNEYGLIDDGRENFLRDCVWKAVHEIDDHGDTLTPQAVAARGWELFDAGAWNGDHKYSYERQCLAKARALLRRLNDGRVELGGKLTTNSEPTYIRAIDNNNNRDGLREALQAYADMLLQDFSSNTKEKRSS